MEIRLTVFIDKKEILPVTLGPAFYIVGPGQAKQFKLGEKVTVTGSQGTRDGEPFMVATTVKRGNEVLRLRETQPRHTQRKLNRENKGIIGDHTDEEGL